jgi:hypothetical protein
MASTTIVPIPPLENGDQLTSDEFARRYEAMPHLKKAELIEGIVHMPAAVRFHLHGNPHAYLIGWLVNFDIVTAGVLVGDNTSMKLDVENDSQPDAVLVIDPDFGGQVEFSADDYIVRAPELVAEVSASGASFDLNAKFRMYERAGVREYLVWRVVDREVDWFVRRGKKFERLTPGDDRILRSEAFPGLWLDAAALVANDMLQVQRVLQQGLAGPEHGDFVDRLAETAKGSR